MNFASYESADYYYRGTFPNCADSGYAHNIGKSTGWTSLEVQKTSAQSADEMEVARHERLFGIADRIERRAEEAASQNVEKPLLERFSAFFNGMSGMGGIASVPAPADLTQAALTSRAGVETTSVVKSAAKAQSSMQMAASASATGLYAAKSGVSLALVLLREEGIGAGDGITDLVQTIIGIGLAIYDAVVAISKSTENLAEEKANEATLLRTREKARAFFEKCRNGGVVSAEEANGYSDFMNAANGDKRFSAEAVDKNFMTNLGLVKEKIFLLMAVLAGINAGHAVVPIVGLATLAVTVLSAVALGLGFVVNAYDLVQGAYGLSAAKEKKEKLSAICAGLETFFKNNTGNVFSRDFEKALCSFFDSQANEANIDIGYSIMRMVRGAIGILLATVGTVLMVMSAGAASPVAALLGAGSSFLYFSAASAKVVMDLKKWIVDEEERLACQDRLAQEDVNLSIFRDSAALPAPTGDQSPMNRYFMLEALADSFVGTAGESGTEAALTELLEVLDFGALEIQILKGLVNMEADRKYKVDIIKRNLAGTMGITV